jgi:hypothetical protein
MHAYKIAVTISAQRTVQLPDEVPAGPAEVIVLVGAGQAAPAEEEEAPSKNDALFSILEALRTSGHGRRSKEEIDTELAEERGSWEDRA